jgi:hypothetical protein
LFRIAPYFTGFVGACWWQFVTVHTLLSFRAERSEAEESLSAPALNRNNELFANTHHVMPVSETVLVPDTYHIILLFFVGLALITDVVLIIHTVRDKSHKGF